MTPKILTLGVLLLVISISNEPAGAEDQRLMMKSGRPVTVADLTLVPSDVAQRSVKDASQGWTLEGHRETEMMILPEMTVWTPPAGKAELRDYYHHLLEGALGFSLVSDVYDIVSKEFPLRDDEGYDATQVESYAVAFRESEIAQRRYTHRAFVESKTAAEFTRTVLNRSPFTIALNLDPNNVEVQQECGYHLGTYFRVRDECFPIEKNGVVAPWFRGLTVNGLIHHHLEADIRARPDFYDAAYMRHHGVLTVVTFQSREAIPELTVSKIGQSMMAKDGRAAQRRVREAQETFRNLGRDPKIEVAEAFPEKVREIIGATPGESIVGRVHHEIINGTHRYLYVSAQVLTDNQRKSLNSAEFRRPGSPFYDVARFETLKPVVRRVLATMKLEPGIELVDEAQLTLFCGNAVVAQHDFFGKPMPKVVRKRGE